MLVFELVELEEQPIFEDYSNVRILLLIAKIDISKAIKIQSDLNLIGFEV